MPEAAGKKRERIAIEQATETVSAEGEPVKTWLAFANMWARAEFLYGRELEAMQKINAQTSVRFTLNYRTDVTKLMRIVWRSTNWNILAILPTEDKFDMAILASVVQ